MAYKQNTRPPREPQGLVRVTGRPPLSVGSSSVRRVSQVRQVEVRTSQEETFVALPWCPRALYALEETHMEHGTWTMRCCGAGPLAHAPSGWEE